MTQTRYYNPKPKAAGGKFNLWDGVALTLIFTLFALFAWGAKEMASPYQLGETIAISLDPHALPFYAVRTILRMGIALTLSLLFTFTVGAFAAKNTRAAQIIIPAIDILQSVPVLSFLSITVVGFIALFPNSLLGPECASIFAIFTAQAWNMALGFYQSLKTVPADITEAANLFRLSAWQKFWRVEVPFSLSSLLWNMMMSMSASWFFVVASEAIAVSNQNILLPGIGSYIATAIKQANVPAVFYAILTMFIVILFYDQFFFRPLLKWAEKFKFATDPDETTSRSWVISLLQRTHLAYYGSYLFSGFADKFINLHLFKIKPNYVETTPNRNAATYQRLAWNAIIITLVCSALWLLITFIFREIPLTEIGHVFLLGAATASRVIVLIFLSSLIWVPVGVWMGLRPNVAYAIQPLLQFVASFPANLLFPLVVIAIVKFHLNVEIWTTPLMILGSQWYILFNVVAGATNLPKDLYLAANNFNVTGWQWWRRFALPGIFPYYITGAITAAGGAWNASIVAEWVSWGDTTLKATGLGAYINEYTTTGDFPRIALGTAMMCLYVLFFNRVLWRPLYNLAESRFRLD